MDKMCGLRVFAVGACAVMSAAVMADPGDSAPAAPVPSSWQHHQLQFDYFGLTTLYTCDGLEDQVRRILLYLGARKDLKVSARGCPGPYNAPSHTAWVSADFYALVPAADARAADTVKAQWTQTDLNSKKPNFMSAGDCELIDDMRSLISDNFTVRGLDFRAACTPRQESIDDFHVRAEVLKAVSTKAG